MLVSTATGLPALGRRGAACVLQQKGSAWTPKKGQSHPPRVPARPWLSPPPTKPTSLGRAALPINSPPLALPPACSHLCLQPPPWTLPHAKSRARQERTGWELAPGLTPLAASPHPTYLGYCGGLRGPSYRVAQVTQHTGRSNLLHPGEQRGHKWAPATMLIPDHKIAMQHTPGTPPKGLRGLSVIQVAASACPNPPPSVTAAGCPTLGLLLLFPSLLSY